MRWICEYTLHHACIVCLLHVLYVYNYFTIGGLISNITPKWSDATLGVNDTQIYHARL